MANIIRKTGESLMPSWTGGWDPFGAMREMLRWDPFREMVAGRLAEEPLRFEPSFEVRETADAYVFRADLPGVAEQDLEISLTGNRLTVSGKREAEEKKEGERYFAYECAYGAFSRSFTLPEGVDDAHVKADLRGGVLTLTLPKKAELQPKRIPVGGGKEKAKA